jgi:hypothetical protein
MRRAGFGRLMRSTNEVDKEVRKKDPEFTQSRERRVTTGLRNRREESSA